MSDQRDDDASVVTKAADFDGDGLSDETEDFLGTNPTDPDSDGDGAIDGIETGQGTDPTKSDSPGESWETRDTDEDGFSDYAETQAGTGALDPTTHPERADDPPADDPAPTNVTELVDKTADVLTGVELDDALIVQWALESLGLTPEEAAAKAAEMTDGTVNAALGAARLGQLTGVDNPAIEKKVQDTIDALAKAIRSGNDDVIKDLAPSLPTGDSLPAKLAQERVLQLLVGDGENPALEAVQNKVDEALAKNDHEALAKLLPDNPELTKPGPEGDDARGRMAQLLGTTPTTPAATTPTPTGPAGNLGGDLGSIGERFSALDNTSSVSAPNAMAATATTSPGGPSTPMPGPTHHTPDVRPSVVDNQSFSPGPYDAWSAQNSTSYSDGTTTVVNTYTDADGNSTYTRTVYDPSGRAIVEDEPTDASGTPTNATPAESSTTEEQNPSTGTTDDDETETDDTGAVVTDDEETAVAMTAADDVETPISVEDGVRTATIRGDSVVNPSNEDDENDLIGGGTTRGDQGGYTDPIAEPETVGGATVNLFNGAGPEFGPEGEDDDTSGGFIRGPGADGGDDAPEGSGGGFTFGGEGGTGTSGGGGDTGFSFSFGAEEGDGLGAPDLSSDDDLAGAAPDGIDLGGDS